MNNVIMRKLVLTDQYQPLSTVPLVASVTVSTPPSNAATVLFRTTAEPAHEVPWVPGEWHTLQRIDLARLEAKGEAGDVLTIVGGTW